MDIFNSPWLTGKEQSKVWACHTFTQKKHFTKGYITGKSTSWQTVTNN